MKKILHILSHIIFVAGGLLLLQLLIFDRMEFNTPNGKTTYTLSVEDAGKSIKESDSFNQMFGASISDALEYGYLKYEYETDENLQNSVSANDIGRGDFGESLRTYNGYFDNGNTNINFYIKASIDGHTQTIHNLGNTNNQENLTKELLDKSSLYLIFDSENNIYSTNSRISENTFFKLLKASGYKDASNIYAVFGLNKDTGAIDDSYRNSALIYNSYTFRMNYKLVAIVMCFFGYLAATFLLTFLEGRYVDKKTGEKGLKLKFYDYSPIEIRLILFAGLAFFIWLLFDNIDIFRTQLYDLYINRFSECLFVAAILLLIISLLLAFFYFGLVRRIKGKIIWKTSIAKKICDWIYTMLCSIYQNKGSFIKTLLTVGGIAIINILLMIGINKSSMPWLYIIVMAVVDFAFGIGAYRSYNERKKLLDTLKSIAAGNVEEKINIDLMHGDNINHAKAVNSIGEAVTKAVETSMKDEKMKADLITNVSHDLKTPLTSIINYVDLLKKEKIDNENARAYIEILDEKSQRLKQMTDDLVEASKISSGNVVLNMEKINLKELLVQSCGEFADKFEEKHLTICGSGPQEAIYINADSRSIYRVIENLFTNICKYALDGTRVYLDMAKENGKAVLIVKNISANEIKGLSVIDLTERFTRGDESRTTEGSGLGLSIAKSLTEAMGGTFNLALDGDLFKVILSFNEISVI